MDSNETDKFIENELKQLWPDWKPSDAEMRVWFGVMARFDYDTARTAAQQYFTDTGGNYKRPKPAGIITKAQVIIQNRNVGQRTTKEPVLTNVYIECLEPPERNPKLEGKRKAVYAATDALQSDPDHLLRCAETMRRKFEQLYGGKWITVQTKPPEDNGLRGELARQKAIRDILQGEDTKTKRWLMTYLKDNTPKETAEGEPVAVGEVMAGVF